MKHIMNHHYPFLVGWTSTLSFALLAADPAVPPRPAPTVPSVEPTVALRTAEQVLNKNIQAIGGRAAIQKVTSRHIKGTLDMAGFGISAPWELQAKAPNKRVTILDIAGMGVLKEGFNGKIGWSENPTAGVTEKKGEELAYLRREAVFNRDLKFKEVYAKLTLQGVQKVDHGEAYVLLATPAEGSPERYFFDTQTGLIVRHEAEYTNDQGKVTIVSNNKDFRVVDGLKLPFTMTLQVTAPNAPEMNLTVKCTEIKHNVPLDDALFEKPADPPK